MKSAVRWLLGFILAATASSAGAADGFVSTHGRQILDGDGKALLLRGINLGNWLVPEGYMFHFDRATSPRLIEEMVVELLGPEEAKAFWARYQDQFVTRADIALIRQMGFNSVRVPFSYRSFPHEAGPIAPAPRGFELLDRVISWCREEKLLVLLDMHCAPGGQTGDNIDDSWAYPFLFESTASQNQLADLWRTIAHRYHDEKTVLGYDLLNEPIAHFFDTKKLNPRLEPLYQRLARDIREVDGHHLLFLGGAQWDSNFKVFGKPFAPGLVYTFHKYWTNPTRDVIQEYLDFSGRYDVPLYMGESGENNNEWIRKFRQMLEENNVGWCFWPYKKVDSTSCVVQVPPTADYGELTAFANAPRQTFEEIRQARAAHPKARAVLLALPDTFPVSNLQINNEYVEALGMKAPADPPRGSKQP